MSEQSVQKQTWGSTFGFIMSSIGYAVGLGAIWKFPYMIGMNGGGIFLLLCAILCILVAIPLAWGEMTLGRYTQCSVLVGMRQLEGGRSNFWQAIGWLGLATSFTLTSYYITIVGDVLFYIFRFISGSLEGLSIDEMADAYTQLNLNMPMKFGWSLVMLVLVFVVIIQGVQKGLEAANKILIPCLFIFLVILGIRGLMLPGGMEGIVWMFTPDFSKLSPGVLYAALNQVFFLAGVGYATLFSFGAYLDQKESDIPFNGCVIILSNLVVAILAGVAIFPSLFAYDMEVASGNGLTFMTLPYVFNEMSFGRLWGGLFFILLFCAGFSTILGLSEGMVSTISDSFHLERKKVTAILMVLLFIFSMPTILSTTLWANVKPLGMDLFTFMDFLAVGIFCPLGCVLIGIYVAYKFPFSKLVTESAIGAKYFRIPKVFKYWYMIVIPIITLFVLVVGILSYLGINVF